MRKLNNKGFTLVEIVIVIVIIAILAAMLVPALTQWIDKSKIKTFTSACGTIRTAVASRVSENYATDSTASVGGFVQADWDVVTADVGKTVSTSAPSNGSYQVTAGSTGTGVDTGFTVSDGKFTGVWDGAKWTVTKNS